MKTIQKLLAALLAVICLFSVTACSGSKIDSTDVDDGEDISIRYGRATVANVTGKDATKLYYKRTGTDQWSDNILSQDYLHNNMGTEITYPMDANCKYDIRLLFEDGSYQDFEGLDIESDAAKGRIIYLGQAPEGAPKKAAKTTAEVTE